MSNEYGIDFKNLKCSKLKELCISKNGIQTGPFGSQLHNEDYVEIGTPIITVEHLGENFIFHENTPKVSKEDAERLNKYTMQQGDIIFSRVGSVDRRAIVSEKETGWLFSGRCLRVRPNPECLDSEYLSYFFGLSGFRSYIRNIAVGATMPSINTKILSEVPIYYPELPVQKQIASHLKALDDKIRLNTQTNRTLEQIAQALFKSWFIDFDPVKAKAAVLAEGGSAAAAERAAMRAISGKSDAELDKMQQTQAQAYQQLATTAALFPCEMEDSELGEIPKGWGIGTLADICTLNKKNWSAKSLPNRIHYIDLAGVKEGVVIESQYLQDQNIPSRARRVLSKYDTIIGTVRPANRSFAFISESGLTGSTGFAVLTPNEDFWREFVYLVATSERNIERLTHLADGAAYPAVRPDIVIREIMIVPTNEIAKAFHEKAAILFERIIMHLESIKMLKQTRDALLPQLLSGSLPLPDEAV